MFLDALSTARDLGRLNEIASVLIRHGLGDAVRRLGIAGLLERAGSILHWEGAKGLATKEPQVHLREALEDLGPTFVKVGQILAGRRDLLPPTWTTELSMLQESVKPVPYEELRPQLVEDLGGEPEEVFREFDREHLAAASIAQVHRATLKNGRKVAVKIRRPGIAATVEKDLRLLGRLAELAEERMPELKRYRPKALVRQFARTLRAELDLRTESRNAERLAARIQEDERMVVPRIHRELTRERLCVMDFLEGPSLGDWLRQGQPGPAKAHDLARRGANAVLRMVLVDGFFHADPHPGNLILLRDGRLGLLDFGMTGRLSEERRHELVGLLISVVQRDEDGLVDILLEWSQEGGADVDALREDCGAFVDRYYGLSLDELDVTAILLDVTELLRENDLFLPGDVAMVLRVLIVLDGLGRALDPDFVMSKHLEPFARRQLARMRSPARVMRHGLREASHLLRGLPRDVRAILANARRGKLHLDIDVQRLEAFGHQLDRSTNRLTVGLITAALIVGTAITLTVSSGIEVFGLPLFGTVGFLSSFVAGVWLLVSILRSQRK